MYLSKYLVLITFTFVKINGDYCLSNDSNPYLYFSTKTPYHAVSGNAKSDTTCKPIQIWIMSRHGTRYGSKSNIIEMKKAIDLRDRLIESYESGTASSTGALCNEDYLAIKNWQWDSSVETQENFLNEQGWQDLFTLAKRYSERYPAILGGPYKPEDYYFRHTLTQRTQQSCKAFIDGLFGNGSHLKVKIETPVKEDEIIEPYSMCKLWMDGVYNNPNTTQEKKNFEKSLEFLQLIEDIIKLTGIKTLTASDINVMYENCRYDKSRYLDKVSPWCAVFTKKQLYVMDFYEDLGIFYKRGYGNEMHPKLGCMPLKHLLETFIKTTSHTKRRVAVPKLVAMFTHDTMIDMFFTALNFANDKIMFRGSNYEDLLNNRKYRTSMNTPFGANVVAVLHECSPEEDELFKVQFFLNEKQMMIPGCDQGLCSWKYLQKNYASALDCNIDFCNN